MGVLDIFFRALVAITTLIVMTLIVYPVFALWSFMFILRHRQGPRAIARIAIAAMKPDFVRISPDAWLGEEDQPMELKPVPVSSAE